MRFKVKQNRFERRNAVVLEPFSFTDEQREELARYWEWKRVQHQAALERTFMLGRQIDEAVSEATAQIVEMYPALFKYADAMLGPWHEGDLFAEILKEEEVKQ